MNPLNKGVISEENRHNKARINSTIGAPNYIRSLLIKIREKFNCKTQEQVLNLLLFFFSRHACNVPEEEMEYLSSISTRKDSRFIFDHDKFNMDYIMGGELPFKLKPQFKDGRCSKFIRHYQDQITSQELILFYEPTTEEELQKLIAHLKPILQERQHRQRDKMDKRKKAYEKRRELLMTPFEEGGISGSHPNPEKFKRKSIRDESLVQKLKRKELEKEFGIVREQKKEEDLRDLVR